MANDDITTIRLTHATKDRLDKYAEKKGDTYDDILNNILDQRENLNKRIIQLQELIDDLEKRQKATT